jgi:hypothetical protein
MTFGAPAPSPPTDALIPPAQDTAPPAEVAEPAPASAEPEVAEPEAAPAEDTTEGGGFETYVAPPPLRPPGDEPPAESAAPETVAPPEPPPAQPVEAAPPAPAPTPEPVAATPAPPAPTPPPEPVVAATVMPDAIQDSLVTPAPKPPIREKKEKREKRVREKPVREKPVREEGEPGAKRNLFPVLVIGGAVLAAIVGFLAGGSGGGDKTTTSGTPAIVAASPDVKAKVPEGWAKLSSVPAVPGLGVADAAAFAPGGKDGGEALVLGAVRKSADNSTLLSTGLIKAAGTLPKKEAVAIGDGLQAYRYRNMKLAGFERPVTIYAVPTTAGVATIACVAPTATCDASANTMQLVSAKSFPVGPSADYAKAVGNAMGALGKATKSGQAKLESAKTPRAQASAAAGLSAAYAKAAKALGGLELSPADTLANQRLVAGLTATSKAYANAAKAARKNKKNAYASAKKAVAAGQKIVSNAMTGLQKAGYDVTT